MKNKFWIIALIAIIGFSMAACDDGDDGATTVHVKGVTLNKNIITLNIGDTETLTATVAPNNATNKAVKWSTSNEAIATVATNGVVTAVAAGSATITVTTADGGKTAICVVTVTGGNSGTPDLSGNITINPSTGVNINTQLTANYSGSETVSYQWKKGDANVGTNSNKYTPTTAGSYTVTVSASGYNSKTSAVVDVNDPSLLALSGTITISPNSGVTVNTQLTATYSGSETISYQWEKDGSSVGTNSNKYTPTTAGNYSVTVSAAGYNSKTSNSVTVTGGGGTDPIPSFIPPGTTVTTLTENVWDNGDLIYIGYEQWFKFTATAGIQYIHVNFGTLNYLLVKVYDSSGTEVGDEQYRNIINSRDPIQQSLTIEQEYYIKVSSFIAENCSGTYQIGFMSNLIPPGTAIITLTENTWANGNLPPSNDVQWFKFTATASTQYIHASFGTLNELYVQVYNSSGNAVGSETKLYSSTKYTSQTLNVGQVYYINVRPYNSTLSGTYQIAFNTTFFPPGTITLTENTWENGNFISSRDEQWFKFTATANTQYIHINFGTITNLYVQLYDSSGAKVGSETQFYSGLRDISQTVTISQVYFIKVAPYNSGTYQIAFNTSTTSPVITITLPSNAIQLTENVWADGNLPTSSSEQWFKFTATANTQYIHVNFLTLTNLNVQTYDSNGNTVGDETYLNSSTKNTSRTVTVGQEYYIKVTSYYSGSYQIGFNAGIIPTGVIQLTEKVWANGNLPTSNSEQWFKFTATASTQYIYAGFITLTKMRIQLYNSSGIAVGDEGSGVEAGSIFGNTNLTSRSVTVGQEYYIRVRPYDSDCSGTYKIAFGTVGLSSNTDNQFYTYPFLTPPDTFTTLTLNTASNFPESIVTWFKFTATSNGHYIVIPSSASYSNANFIVYDSNGFPLRATQLYYVNSSNSRTSIYCDGLMAGQEYYIRVSAFSGRGSGQLKFNTTGSW